MHTSNIHTLSIGTYDDINEFSAIKNLTAHDWHVYWAFHDPDLIKENNELNSKYKIATLIKNRGCWNDEYLSQDRLLAFRREQDKLAKKYCLSRSLMDMLNTLPLVYYRPKSQIVNMGYDQDEDVFKFEVKPDITKEDFEKGYTALQNYIKLFRINKSSTKRKELAHPDLIYAVFKALQNNMRYKEIFNLYYEDRLPYYTRKSRQAFLTQDDLERYYNKYRPDKYS